MESYLVINMETKEVYQRNGRAAEFGTFHQARVVRITLNDQTKERKGYAWGMGEGWTERKKDWQVVKTADVTIKTIQKRVSRKVAECVYEKVTEPIHFASGDFKAVHRAPQPNRTEAKRDNRINELTTIVSGFQASLKSLRSQQVRTKNRLEKTSDPQRKMVCMQKLIELKEEEIRIQSKLEPAQKELLTKMARKRSSSTQASKAQGTAQSTRIRRRKTS